MEDKLNLNSKNEEGFTALILAVLEKNIESINNLALLKAKLDLRDNNGLTALMHAICCGHDEISLFLIENGAGLDIKDNNGRTALMHSVCNNRDAIVCVLIEKGAKLSVADNNGNTALMYEIKTGKKKVMKGLISENKIITARREAKEFVLINNRKKIFPSDSPATDAIFSYICPLIILEKREKEKLLIKQALEKEESKQSVKNKLTQTNKEANCYCVVM